MFFSHRRYIYHVNRSNSRQIWQSSLTKGSNSINNVRERRSIQLFRRSWFDPRGQNARCRVHDIVSVFVRVQLYSTAYIPVSNITGYKLWPQQGGRSKTRTTTAFGMRAFQTCVVDKVVVRSGTLEMCCGILEACYREISKGKGMEWRRKAKKNWAVVSPLNDRAARGELRGDALTIGTRGTYRAIFEEIKRILEPQLAVQGKWLSDRRWIFYKSRKEVWSN